MVDPDGFLGDPAYDLGVALRDRGFDLAPGELAPALRRWARLLAGPAGLDPTLAEPFLRTATGVCDAG